MLIPSAREAGPWRAPNPNPNPASRESLLGRPRFRLSRTPFALRRYCRPPSRLSGVDFRPYILKRERCRLENGKFVEREVERFCKILGCFPPKLFLLVLAVVVRLKVFLGLIFRFPSFSIPHCPLREGKGIY